MNKIVINNCYGGFSLSPLAVKRYFKIKYPEVQLFFYKLEYFPSESYKKVPIGEADTIVSKDLGDFYEGTIDDSIYVSSYPCESRHDPILVQVVEELGDKANGRYADLKIVEVPGNKYRVCEYDGQEWVETPESLDWITIT